MRIRQGSPIVQRGRGVEEAQIVRGVVCDDDIVAQKLDEAWPHLRDARLAGEHGVLNARQTSDEPRQAYAGIDELLKLFEHAAGVDARRADLDDAGGARADTRGFQIDHDEAGVAQRARQRFVQAHVPGGVRHTPDETRIRLE